MLGARLRGGGESGGGKRALPLFPRWEWVGGSGVESVHVVKVSVTAAAAVSLPRAAMQPPEANSAGWVFRFGALPDDVLRQILSGLVTFFPSHRFVGEKAGFVFKMGPDGLGYYHDDQATPASYNNHSLNLASTCHELRGVALSWLLEEAAGAVRTKNVDANNAHRTHQKCVGEALRLQLHRRPRSVRGMRHTREIAEACARAMHTQGLYLHAVKFVELCRAARRKAAGAAM